MQRDHQTMLQSLKADHKQELDRLNESADRKLELLKQEMAMSKQKALDELTAKF